MEAGHRRRTWLPVVGAYLVAAAFGGLLGARGLLPFVSSRGTSTPLARVGFALQADGLQASPRVWAALGSDVASVRSGVKSEDRDVFDLVVALRGLESGGNSDWSRAEQLCRGLKWMRCDRTALEELKRRSRP